MSAIDTIFYIAILVMSVVVHEVSHGFMAEYFGDKTARYAGRLTLNPIKHLDLFGSIILPVVLVLSQAPFLFGWAKPVPYNPNNLTDKKWGEMWVASAGILSNLFLALFFGLILRFSVIFYGIFSIPEGLILILSLIVMVNLALAVFNLLPIAPLDGSKILFAFMPKSWTGAVMFLEQYSFILLLVFIVFFSGSLYPILSFLYELITGLAF